MNELTEIQEKTNLSIQEADRFDDLEICIANGLQTFVEVGNALAEIRDARLYRMHYGTFEDYCQKRWGIERRQAYRMMDAAAVVSNVSNWTQNAPATESQARPLTSLTPDQQREVWQTAVNTAPNGKVTAAHVEATKRDYLAPAIEYDETETSTGYFGDDYEDSEYPNAFIKTTVEEFLGLTQEENEQTYQPAINGNGRVISPPHVSHNSGNNEWYTPSEIIEAARSVMGNIDLDPASNDLANDTVRALHYYTQETNGLDKDWLDNVWMNPPYASDLIGKFCEKLHKEYIAGNVTTAVVLVNNATETAWFRLLASIASGICFPSSRVKFWKPDGNTGQPLQGQAILYIGDDVGKFAKSFCHIGFIVEVVNA